MLYYVVIMQAYHSSTKTVSSPTGALTITTPAKQIAITLLNSPIIESTPNAANNNSSSSGVGVISYDNASLGMWKQLRDKIKSMKEEVLKWLEQQHLLFDVIKQLYINIDKGDTQWEHILTKFK